MESNPDVLAPTVKAGVERVITSKKDYAFILESTMNEYFNQRRPCTTVKVSVGLKGEVKGNKPLFNIIFLQSIIFSTTF